MMYVKLSALLLALVMTPVAHAKDYYNDNKYGSNDKAVNDKYQPRSYTLDSDRSPYKRSVEQSDRYPSVNSNKGSGSYRRGSQVNDNGLIINTSD